MGVQPRVLRQSPIDRRVFADKIRVVPQGVLVEDSHTSLCFHAEGPGVWPSGAGRIQDAPEYDERLPGQEGRAGRLRRASKAEVREGNEQEDQEGRGDGRRQSLSAQTVEGQVWLWLWV